MSEGERKRQTDGPTVRLSIQLPLPLQKRAGIHIDKTPNHTHACTFSTPVHCHAHTYTRARREEREKEREQEGARERDVGSGSHARFAGCRSLCCSSQCACASMCASGGCSPASSLRCAPLLARDRNNRIQGALFVQRLVFSPHNARGQQILQWRIRGIGAHTMKIGLQQQ